MKNIPLGSEVIDVVSGVKGLATSMTELISGNVQYAVQPKSEDGKTMPDTTSTSSGPGMKSTSPAPTSQPCNKDRWSGTFLKASDMKIETQYEELLEDVLRFGQKKADRTGTGTRSVFGRQMRFNLAEGFPLVTTKKVFTKPMVTELLWFLRGDTNVKWLQERDCKIWDAWAAADGSLGPVYGKQWRSWPTPDGGHIDQITRVIHTLRTNPDSRRIIVSAWNVAELDQMALMPCHALFQFYVADGKLSCQLYQRSADLFLGLPFNIASCALLTHMVAQQCDLDVGDFIWTGGDCHIYDNHVEQVDEQLSRAPYPLGQLAIKRRPASIFDYEVGDFEFLNYHHHPAIKAPVAV